MDLSGSNIALGKTATQSSTLGKQSASFAVDGDLSTYSHTLDQEQGDLNAWLEIDFEESYDISSITIHNHWCDAITDQPKCLCDLKDAVLTLIDISGAAVNSFSTGDTCGELTLEFTIESPKPEFYSDRAIDISAGRLPLWHSSLASSAASTFDATKGIQSLASILRTGKISNDFCLGDCSEDGSLNRRINGTLQVLPSESCDGVKAVCSVDSVTVATASYVLLKSIDKDIANLLANTLDQLGPFGSFGLRNASVSIEATSNLELTLTISGSPTVPTITTSTPDIAKFFIELLSNFQFRITGTMSQDSLGLKLEALVDMPSDSSSIASFQDTGLFFDCEFRICI
jgi:hypothetical protein